MWNSIKMRRDLLFSVTPELDFDEENENTWEGGITSIKKAMQNTTGHQFKLLDRRLNRLTERISVVQHREQVNERETKNNFNKLSKEVSHNNEKLD